MKALRIRLLPVTVIAATMVLGVRITDIFQEGEGALVTLAQAQAQADAGNETAAEDETAAAKEPVDPEAAEKTAEAEPATALSGSLAERDPTTFSPSEIALLENLARRRDQIEGRAADLDVRENLLAATEQRIDEKIATLQQLEKRIQGLVKKHDEAEEYRFARLVKVYEKMKAKDAARIFEQIEMDVLIEVSARMKETSIAGIMAEMTPERAQELTIELATREDLEERLKR
ncbi:MotE family protein [Minwuia thermotolerans]|uniref:Magnesium transporter MgtE intracellular domain-containing protein n=1 Tax=Minwuia thermotolerans TaxID=2056226 RepID=A0A2M9FXR3_9PROT|nr:hypothetical protein [Minwuia thermotolerans]PJK28247.1 hypothetical protein CVT23_17905 [Minwuia thermotolerans]